MYFLGQVTITLTFEKMALTVTIIVYFLEVPIFLD